MVERETFPESLSKRTTFEREWCHKKLLYEPKYYAIMYNDWVYLGKNKKNAIKRAGELANKHMTMVIITKSDSVFSTECKMKVK
jgi:hypothetical protein